MLTLKLMVESARRQATPSRPLLEDAALQAAYCLDAPDEVQDGAEWFDDTELYCCGPVPRIVPLRETPNRAIEPGA